MASSSFSIPVWVRIFLYLLRIFRKYHFFSFILGTVYNYASQLKIIIKLSTVMVTASKLIGGEEREDRCYQGAKDPQRVISFDHLVQQNALSFYHSIRFETINITSIAMAASPFFSASPILIISNHFQKKWCRVLFNFFCSEKTN